MLDLVCEIRIFVLMCMDDEVKAAVCVSLYCYSVSLYCYKVSIKYFGVLVS